MHALDALRAGLMLLGILLHVACSFQLGEGDSGWPYRDPEQSLGATLSVIAIHVVRMPLFFVVAGLTAALLVRRRGTRDFILSRLRRVALPLFVGWLLLTPLVGFAFAHALAVAKGASPDGSITYHRPLPGDPAHLWFLYYLLLVTLAMLILRGLIALAPGIRAAVKRLADAIFVGRWRRFRVPTIALALTPLLLSMEQPTLDTPKGWTIEPRILAFYFACFALGWAIERCDGLLPSLRQGAWLRTVGGVLGIAATTLLALVCYGLASEGKHSESRTAFVVAQVAGAWTLALLSLGLLGVCERAFSRERPFVRSLVDASYWIYLIHLPLSVYAAVSLRGWEASAAAKIAVATLLVTALCIASYQAALAVLPRRA
jgi:peptidoglycan/LPS O-acetylase OafA/YrhL